LGRGRFFLPGSLRLSGVHSPLPATLYFFPGQYDDSLSDIAHTLALEPRHFGAMAGMGMIMEALGEDEKALAAYKQALAIDPQLTNIQLEVFLLEDKLKGKRA